MLITKDLLYAGRYKLPDGRTFVCKPSEISYYAKRMQDWLKAKLPIPVRWEHEGDTELSAADKAKNTFSHAADAVVHADGFVEVKFPAHDEDDRKKLPKVRFVSPTIRWDVVDSTGKLWPGPSITEIALTPVPIQHKQKPFPFTLSQGMNGIPPIHLSLAAYEPVRLAGDFMADDTAAAAGQEPENAEPIEDETKPSEEVDEEATPEDAEALATKLKSALKHLVGHGLVLGEDIPDDFEQFLDRLITACKTKKAAEGGEMGEMPGAEPGAPGGGGAKEVEGPILMSAGIKKIVQDNLKLRVEKLWSKKQITKQMRDALLAELKTVKLSLSAKGEMVQGPLFYKIAAYEDLPENFTAFRRDVQMSSAREIEDPAEAHSEEKTVERQQKAGKALAGCANGKLPERIE